MAIIALFHHEITQKELEDIIKIKSSAWPYSYDEQLKWIQSNINEQDIHILLSEEGEYVAYLNLINLKVEINKTIFDCFGVGNVCCSRRGKGFGRQLMRETNKFIKASNNLGLLFCKDSLVDFYTKNAWMLVAKNKVKLGFDIDVNTMLYNQNGPLDSLIYSGKLF